MRFSCGDKGFSLIELSISLVVIGLLMSSALTMMRVNQGKQIVTKTKENLDILNKAISLYYERHGKLPCPAGLNYSDDNPLSGKEADCESFTTTSALPSDAQLVITNVKDSENPPEQSKIITGYVPYRDLNLSKDKTKDGRGNDLIYAVTGHLTQEDTYWQRGGLIKIVDQNDLPLTSDLSHAQYVLLARGERAEPLLSPACTQPIGTNYESENCNGDEVFRHMGVSEGAVKYDDIVSYFTFVAKIEAVRGACDLVSYLREYGVEDAYEIASEKDAAGSAWYPKPGEIVNMCNRRVLSALNSRSCILFICRNDQSIKKLETIE